MKLIIKRKKLNIKREIAIEQISLLKKPKLPLKFFVIKQS